MARIIDADSHFMEPLDIWQHYIEPQYRDRCLRFVPRPDSDRYMILIEENTRARFTVHLALFEQKTLDLISLFPRRGDSHPWPTALW